MIFSFFSFLSGVLGFWGFGELYLKIPLPVLYSKYGLYIVAITLYLNACLAVIMLRMLIISPLFQNIAPPNSLDFYNSAILSIKL